ncbi:MAG: glutamine--fructose-6-phosphate transaminase (isomerizing), partial [Clostridia bacterium]|nr:glutamine--fructose-6-phosphate transaminase (isomerizing) [Clostridia bacterium]
MCGIVGYVGKEDAAPILLNGLSKLEYRGYDSAGVAVFDGDRINVEKCKGRLKVLSEKIDGGKALKGKLGIGHTRWATHGVPSDINSHPHTNEKGTFAVVHNGIIENYIKLRKYLTDMGYHFKSETDTEVVAHLFDYCYNDDMLDTAIKMLGRLEGSYALGILSKQNPDRMIAVRKDSPLIVGLSPNGNFIASDMSAVLPYTRDVYLLEDNEIVELRTDGVTIYDMDKRIIHKDIFKIDWDISSVEKGGYEHFMIKEIMEQPKAIKDTISPRIKDGKIVFEELSFSDEYIKNIKKIFIVACGSAYHVGMVGKYILEDMVRIPVEVDLASEFRYRNPILSPDTLVIAISQSGETADTIAAIREAKRLGSKILSIVNVVGSTIARESDGVIYTWAGPEIAVATTKAYSTQLAVMYMLSLYFANKKGIINDTDLKTIVDHLETIPSLVQMMLENKDNLQYYASKNFNSKNIFFLGRGIDYAIALEGSLKLKEISYINSEAYAAGELKHGTISLIEDGTFVIAVAIQDKLFPKMLSNIKEVKTRGAKVMAIAKEGNKEIEQEA